MIFWLHKNDQSDYVIVSLSLLSRVFFFLLFYTKKHSNQILEKCFFEFYDCFLATVPFANKPRTLWLQSNLDNCISDLPSLLF